jgi:hypothetical protein
MRRSAALVACLATIAVGCTSAPPDVKKPASTLKSSNGPGEPRIEIISPKPGDVVSGGEVEIRTRVRDFDLVDKFGKKNKVGQGHIVYYRLESKDAKIPTQKNLLAHVGGRGIFTSYSSPKQAYVWPDTPGRGTPPGTYTFAVQLVQNNRTPLSPPQYASVRIEIRP